MVLMQHTLSEAARLAGVNRTTIWRHAKQGKVSLTKGRDGNPRVETSELIRVYGELQHPKQPKEQQVATPPESVSLEQLEQLIQAAVAPLVSEIEQLREQLRLIEFKPNKAELDVPIAKCAEDDPEWPQTAESFADLQKRREIRAKYQKNSVTCNRN